MKIFSFLLALAPFISFGQAAKDSLLLKDYETVKEKLELMEYLDHKAVRSFVNGRNADGETNNDFDFAAFYKDSVLAGNPTGIDISEYLDFRKGKQPKNADMFEERTVENNAESLFKLTKKYGYLCGQRIVKLKPEGRLRSGILCTQRTDAYHLLLKDLFQTEYKIGNMPESEYVFFMTMEDVLKRGGVMTDADIAKINKAGISIN